MSDDGPGRGLLVGQNALRSDFGAVFIGKHAEAPHRGVWMDVRGAHVVYVMGKRRSGKSYTLGALAESLVAASWIRQGSEQQGVLILDTMNVFLTMPFAVSDTYSDSSPDIRELNRWRLQTERTQLNLFAPAGTTMPRESNADTITLRASDLGPEEWCGLFDADPFVDPLGHLIATLHAKLASEGVVDKQTGRRTPPRDEFAISDLLHALEVDRDVDGFQRDTREALRRRLESINRYPIFGDRGLDVPALVQPGTVTVLLLRDLDAEMRSVMVSLIVKRVMKLRALSEQQERMIPLHMSRAAKLEATDPVESQRQHALAQECAERAKAGIPRCWLIIDEAHNYIPARSAVPSRKPLKKYVDEGRNLGLSIVVATQQPSGLDPSIQRNADILFIHALSHQDDIVAAGGMLNTAMPADTTVNNKYRVAGSRSFEVLVRSLPLGYALVSTDRANRLFPIQVRPRLTVHGGAAY